MLKPSKTASFSPKRADLTLFRKQFYEKPKKKGVFIEKKKYRLDLFNEKKQISGAKRSKMLIKKLRFF